MVTSCSIQPITTIRGFPEEGSNSKMSPSTPGRRRNVREYVPPHLRDAMSVTRLANAHWARTERSRMRYVIVCNVHEGIDPEQPLWILDSTVAEQNRQACLNGQELWQVSNRYGPTGPHGHEYLLVSELLERLPEDLRKRALHS